MNLYLQTIVESIQFENLPQEWVNFDFARFSNKKTLFDYQQQALKNALKALYKYYKDCKEKKEEFLQFYKDNGLIENIDYKLNGNRKLRIFEEFDKDYKIENGTIAFYHFINRMSFWMATGSGKTLVIVKLLELLGNLIKNDQIPKNDILFLTYREDLIEQFKNHIDEFNKSNNNFCINLYNLKEYENVKRINKLKFGNEIDVFYYRSDLISDEHKDKIVDFRNYDNNGNWYILLDEAHKGDKKDSKRQLYYSILSRNGFMFNFSATFTDPIDFATCVFNFNLEKFITQGYGKHIYISQSNIEAISNNNDFTKRQKRLIITKILLLHTLIAKLKPQNYYHKPLILTLVNSVNTEDSDLELFFKEIEKIAREGVDDTLLDDAKEELKNGLNHTCEFENAAKEELKNDLKHTCEFDNEKIKTLLNAAKEKLKNDLNHTCEFENETIEIDDIDSISENDIFLYVFNAESRGNLEILKIPGNKQELVFKLTTTDKPFGLIKIGDITEWLKGKLSNYQIIERFENESIFKNLNQDDSDITLLMGSRAFYEGWDSNRPNIILYINIGKGTDARKFVLQSIGRGVRIEPLPNKRKRLQFVYNNNEIDKNIFDEIKDKIKPLETLFIYGTKSENLKEVVETLKQEKQGELIGDLFEINPDTKDKLLLIPTYKESDKILVDENYTIKFEISLNDLNLTREYFDYIGEKIALVKYDCQPKVLNKVKESFSTIDTRIDTNTSDYYLVKDIPSLNKPDLLINQIFKHFSLRNKEFKEFKELENEIIHFKQIKLTEKKRKEIKEKIKQVVLKFKEKDKKIAEVTQKIQQEPQKASKYVKEIEKITNTYLKESEMQYGAEKIKFKYLPNHYYLPVALSESEKEVYFTHIIKTKSEVDFVEKLEEHLGKKNNFFKQFDWWFFSKIDETLDEVYIPYYQPKTNRIEKFKPDFIFWLKKDNNYTILFVDPKGTEHTDGYRKIDGYSSIFEEEKNKIKQSKSFSYNGFEIKVKLKLKTNDIGNVLEKYRQYWFDNLENLFTDITPANSK